MIASRTTNDDTSCCCWKRERVASGWEDDAAVLLEKRKIRRGLELTSARKRKKKGKGNLMYGNEEEVARLLLHAWRRKRERGEKMLSLKIS